VDWTLTFSLALQNVGHGPALQTSLLDTLPDGSQVSFDLGVIPVLSSVARSVQYQVPANACPMNLVGHGRRQMDGPVVLGCTAMRLSMKLAAVFTVIPVVATPMPRQAGRTELRLPGWKSPVRFGMSLEEVRRAAPAPLDQEGPGARCGAGRQCLVHTADYTSKEDPINYWLDLEFGENRLAAIRMTCNSTEGCGDEHPLYRFWKAQTGTMRRPARRVGGILWLHSATIEEDSGDLSEEFEIRPATKD
jgi:hypothetical protein